jgi:hypothetical protein
MLVEQLVSKVNNEVKTNKNAGYGQTANEDILHAIVWRFVPVMIMVFLFSFHDI